MPRRDYSQRTCGDMTLESRQLAATTDTTRSSWSETALHPWKVVDHLKTPEDIAAYLQAAAEDGTSDMMAAAISDAAKQRQQSESIRQSCADMADLVEHAKAGEFREQS